MFRREVIDAKQREWLTPIQLAMPISYRVLGACSLLASLLLIAILIFGSYTRHESAHGVLVPAAGLLSTRATSNGTVTRVLVGEGDLVLQDQPLLELSTDLDSVSLGKTRASIGDELRMQQVRLDADLANHAQLVEQRSSGLVSRLGILRGQLAQIDDQIRIQVVQARSARELLEKLRPLGTKGVVSGVQIEQQRATALSAEGELASLKRQRFASEQEISAQNDQLRQLPLTSAAEESDIRRKRAEIDQALTQNESQRAIVFRASQTGTIANLAVKSGDSIVSGTRLLSIVPNGSLLQAELWLPSRAIGFLNSGDRVTLRYEAFPYQKFGLHYGVVTDVSRSAIAPTELEVLSGKKAEESAYRVLVRLDRQAIIAYGKTEPLKPGMALTGDVLLDRRSLIEWLFEPLLGLKQAMGTNLHG